MSRRLDAMGKRYAILFGQIVGDFQIFVVNSRAYFVGLHVFESGQQSLLVLLSKSIVGHSEQAMVFFSDVFS